MRKDERGYFYFVDRIGDVPLEGRERVDLRISEALTAFPGITEASVYGVAVPGADGRAGMAVVVSEARSISRRCASFGRTAAGIRASGIPARARGDRNHRHVQAPQERARA
jgi:acyl-CoA synthetase (AMP-forming)/AMP-acid ligase II